MSLSNIFDIAGSAMGAQAERLNLTASNLANADTVATSPDTAYKARQPIFAAIFQGLFPKGSAAVQSVGVVESQAENLGRYAPEHPLANADGYVFESNVDTIEEMANMISASRSYQNNVEVLNTSKELLLRTLRLGE